MSAKRLPNAVCGLLLGVLAGCGGKAPEIGLVSKDCAVDRINEQTADVVLITGDSLRVSGWAADSTTSSVPERGSVQVLNADGNMVLRQAFVERSPRPDVAEFFKRPAYAKAGFDASFQGISLPAGEYGFSISMQRQDAIVVCQSQRKIAVK